jgi:hypothetical protein
MTEGGTYTPEISVETVSQLYNRSSNIELEAGPFSGLQATTSQLSVGVAQITSPALAGRGFETSSQAASSMRSRGELGGTTMTTVGLQAFHNSNTDITSILSRRAAIASIGGASGLPSGAGAVETTAGETSEPESSDVPGTTIYQDVLAAGMLMSSGIDPSRPEVLASFNWVPIFDSFDLISWTGGDDLGRYDINPTTSRVLLDMQSQAYQIRMGVVTSVMMASLSETAFDYIESAAPVTSIE